MLNGDKKINSRLMFITGIILVIIAGITFVTTNWNVMTGFHKTGVMCLMTAMFFGSSVLAGKIKLENTGNALYTLGCFFSALTVMGFGWFKLLGEWFSFVGEGRMFFFASAALALLIASLSGAHKYSRRHYALIMWCSLTVFVVCLLFGIRDCINLNGSIISVSLSLYSLLTVLMQRKMLSVKNNALRRTYHLFVLINTAVLGSLTLFGTRDFFTMSIFTVSWLKISLNEKEDMAGGVISGLFMFMAIYTLTNPAGAGDFTITLAAFAAAASLVAKGLPVNKSASKIFGIISIGAVFVTLCLCFGSLVTDWSLSSLAGIAILLANNIILIYRGERSMKYVLPFTFAFFAAGSARLADMNAHMPYIVLTALALSGFLCTQRLVKLRSVLSDVMTGCLIIYGLRYASADAFIYTSLALFLAVTVFLLMESKSAGRFVLSYIFPYLLLAMLCTDKIILGSSRDLLFHCVFLFLAFAAVLIRDKRFLHLEISMLIASVVFSIFTVPSSKLCFAFMFTALWILRAYKSRTSKEYLSTIIAVFEAYLSVLLLHDEYENLSLCILLCAVPFITMALSLIPSRLKKRLALVGEWAAYSSILPMLLLITESTGADLITTGFFSLLTYVFVCKRGSNSLAIMPIAYIYGALTVKAVSELEVIPMTMLLFAAAIGINAVSGLFRKYQKIEYPLIFGAIPVLALLIKCDDMLWGFLLGSMLLLLSAVTRDDSQLKSALFSGSSMLFAAALILQRLVTVPELIYSEYIAAVIMCFMFSLRLIWGKNEAVSMLGYTAGFVCLLGLLADAAKTELTADSAILAVIGFTLIIVCLYTNRKKWYYLGCGAFYSALILMLCFMNKAENYELLLCGVLALAAYIVICLKDSSAFAAAPIIYIYCLISHKAALLYEVNMIMALYAAAIGINIAGGIFKKYQKIEYTAICGAIPVLTLLTHLREPFFGLFLGSVLLCLSAASAKDRDVKRALITCSAFLLSAALILQKCAVIPKIIRSEYLTAIIMAFAISLRYIWGRNKIISMVIYLTGIGSLVFLFTDAAIGGLVADGIILGLISFAVMLSGFLAKKKKWFILGTASLVFVSIYLTKDFWLSLGWWAYLMLVGIALIAVAGINEWKKRMK